MRAAALAVLVVGDDKQFQHMARRALGQAGFSVTLAADANAALAAVGDQPPHIAVVEVVMPGTSGFELY